MQAIFWYQKTWLLLLGDSPNLCKWIVFVNFKMMFTLVLILLYLKEKDIWPLTFVVVFFLYMDCHKTAIANPMDKDDSVPHWVFLFFHISKYQQEWESYWKNSANTLAQHRIDQNLHFVKNVISVKYNKVMHHNVKCACILSAVS